MSARSNLQVWKKKVNGCCQNVASLILAIVSYKISCKACYTYCIEHSISDEGDWKITMTSTIGNDINGTVTFAFEPIKVMSKNSGTQTWTTKNFLIRRKYLGDAEVFKSLL